MNRHGTPADVLAYTFVLLAVILAMWAWSERQHDECAASCPDRNGLMVKDAMGFPRCVCTPMGREAVP